MKIKKKLLVQALFLAVVPTLVTALIIAQQASQSSFAALEKKSREQLTSLRELKKSQVVSYLDAINAQVLSLSKSPAVIAAADQFTEQFHQPADMNLASSENALSSYYQNSFSPVFREKNTNTPLDVKSKLAQLDDLAVHFQNKYIATNPFPLGSKDKLDHAGDSNYDQVHQQYHPMFQDYLTRFGYYDIFIVDIATGHVVYSVFKELDYATSLKTGPYANTGLARAFNKAVKLDSSEKTVLVDFDSYFPSYNQAASFIASPIAAKNGQSNAVLIFQMPIAGINNIMTSGQQWQQVGLGLSGETYLVGPDNKLRSESRFLIEDKQNYFKALAQSPEQINLPQIKSYDSALGLQFVNTPGADQALQGHHGFARFADYRGIEVLSAYTFFNYGDQRWALMAELDVDEAFADANQLSDDLYYYAIICLVIIALISVIIGLISAKILVTPINELVERITDISEGEGDLTVELALASRRDEIGDVGRAFNRFVAKIRKIIIDIDLHAGQLAASSEELTAVTMETNNIVILQKGKTDLATQVMIEFSGSISEIADNSLHTSNLTLEANAESIKGADLSFNAQRAINELVQSVNLAANELHQLNTQVADITGILTVIDSIADQTNLLALNAAIEAARAGESGRGFAVVADEVRTLAGKTQESTVEIQRKIAELKLSSKKSVDAMSNASQEAVKGIKLVEDTAKSLKLVSSLVSDVNAKNSENATVAKQQSVSMNDVHRNIIDIAEYTENTSSASMQTSQASNELAKLAVNMSSIVQQFKY